MRIPTLVHLRRLVLWGGLASGAVLLAGALATQTEIGAERAATMLSSLANASIALLPPGRVGNPAATGRAGREDEEVGHLAAAVRDLRADDERLAARVAAVEHTMDDVTGSTGRAIQAAEAESGNAWPAKTEPKTPTAAVIASVVDPVQPPPQGIATPLPANPLTASEVPGATSAAESKQQQAYGVDIGTALSIETLRSRWAAVRAARPRLFDGLQPTVSLVAPARSSHVMLRLVAGPVADAAAAAHLCAELAPYRMFCEPTMYDPQHVALR